MATEQEKKPFAPRVEAADMGMDKLSEQPASFTKSPEAEARDDEVEVENAQALFDMSREISAAAERFPVDDTSSRKMLTALAGVQGGRATPQQAQEIRQLALDVYTRKAQLDGLEGKELQQTLGNALTGIGHAREVVASGQLSAQMADRLNLAAIEVNNDELGKIKPTPIWEQGKSRYDDLGISF